MSKRNRIWLILPMWLWFAVDVTLTLHGQLPEYWAGDYSTAMEGNPIAYLVLIRGPWLFAGLAVVWGIFVGIVAVYWTHPIIAWVAAGAALTHAIGGCSWLVWGGKWGWAIAIAYLAVASEVSWWCWRRSKWAFRRPLPRPESNT